jgi:hypothetical protein
MGVRDIRTEVEVQGRAEVESRQGPLDALYNRGGMREIWVNR